MKRAVALKYCPYTNTSPPLCFDCINKTLKRDGYYIAVIVMRGACDAPVCEYWYDSVAKFVAAIDEAIGRLERGEGRKYGKSRCVEAVDWGLLSVWVCVREE